MKTNENLKKKKKKNTMIKASFLHYFGNPRTQSYEYVKYRI